MTEGNQPNLLNYASPRAADSVREALWRRSVRRFVPAWKAVPLPAVAILLLVPVYLARHFEWPPPLFYGRFENLSSEFLLFLALFLPGALRRADRRSIAIAAGGALAAFGVHQIQDHVHIRGLYFYLDLTATTAVLILRAVCERVGAKDRQWKTFGWSALGAVGAACIISAGVHYLNLAGFQFWLGTGHGGRHSYFTGEFLRPIITVALTWFIIPRSVHAGAARDWRRNVFVAASGFAIIAWIALFTVALMPLARRSLRGHGPFDLVRASWLIDQSGNAADIERLYSPLEHADWNESEDYLEMGPDWKRNYISVLADRDPRAAQRLSQMLLAHPNARMAEQCAWLFAREHRYETAPLLLRYSFNELMPHMPTGETTERYYVEALEEMRVPQVARQIINTEWMRLANKNAAMQYDADTRQRLAKLLGSDAGPDPHQWNALYQRVIGSVPTPLSPEEQREANLVTESARRCRSAFDRLQQAGLSGNAMPLPDMNVVTTDDFSREIDAYVESVDDDVNAVERVD